MATDHTWFNPLPAQQEFIRSASKETFYAGGVGSGKTLSGSIKALWACMMWPGTVGLVGRQTYRALEDTTKKVMLYGDDKPAIFTPEMGKYYAGDDKFVLKNGSEILFRSLEDHNIEKLLSLNLGWVYVDEVTETTLKVWLTLLGRLRHPMGPRIAWGTTNPNGHDWVWKRAHPDAGIDDPQTKIFIQPTQSNPHLAPDYIEMLLKMPTEWVKRFVYASFDTAAGMIWDMWDSKVHVYDAKEVGRLPAKWRRFESMDHGRRNPTAWLWWVIDPDGFMVTEDEYYVEGLLPSQHALSVRAQRETVAPGIHWPPVIAPPDTFRRGNDGRTVAQEYTEAAQIHLQMGNDNVEAGLLRVSEWLQRVPDLEFPDWHPLARTLGPDGKGAPRLMVASRCTNLRTEIPDYRWRDLSGAAERNQDQPEEPRKKDDHAVDAWRYGVMSRPRPAYEASADEVDARPKVGGREQTTRGLIDATF